MPPAEPDKGSEPVPATPAHAELPEPTARALEQPDAEPPAHAGLSEPASLADELPEPATDAQDELPEPATDAQAALPEPATDAPAELPEPERPRTRRRWPWLVLLTLILVAALGLIVGVGIVLRGRSLGPPLPSDTAARPTFVIATVPSPSPSGSPRPAAVPSATINDQYIVQAGDTLRSIAQQVYADAEQWPRIYSANRDTIGPDPDTLSEGMRLRIPRP